MNNHARTGNVNGRDGQTGSLEQRTATADLDVSESLAGVVLEIDPGGGTITVTLGISVGAGFFFEVLQTGAGTITFAAAAGTSIDSAGAGPSLTAPWTSARMRRRSSGNWVVEGAVS